MQSKGSTPDCTPAQTQVGLGRILPDMQDEENIKSAVSSRKQEGMLPTSLGTALFCPKPEEGSIKANMDQCPSTFRFIIIKG